jgi:hypothetical protein
MSRNAIVTERAQKIDVPLESGTCLALAGPHAGRVQLAASQVPQLRVEHIEWTSIFARELRIHAVECGGAIRVERSCLTAGASKLGAEVTSDWFRI